MAKHLSALGIMKNMARAVPANAIKLTDPKEYDKISYQEFFSQFPQLEISSDKKAKLEELQDEMNLFTLAPGGKEDKLYVYFILKLQEILYDTARA